MVLKLYGHPMSVYTRFVALICKEKKIPYEFVLVDLAKGEHKSAEFTKNQPFGVVPYIDDDGFILYESRAIARYLIKKYPDQGTAGLIPTGLKEEALFEQAASIEVSNYDSQIAPLIVEKVIMPLTGRKTDEARVETSRKGLEAKLDVYNIILGKQKYMAGDKVTLADLAHLPFGSMLSTAGLGHLITDRPNVNRWWNDIYDRPTWQAVKDGPGDSIRSPM